MAIADLSIEEIEIQFVDKFIVEDRKGRAAFELRSKKKRRIFFSGLNGFGGCIDVRWVLNINNCSPNEELDILFDILVKNKSEEVCYLMSYMPEIDRKFVSLRDGLSKFLACSMESILICGPHLALLHGEQGVASPPIWILLRQTKSGT